jgi:hypothetical protein
MPPINRQPFRADPTVKAAMLSAFFGAGLRDVAIPAQRLQQRRRKTR